MTDDAASPLRWRAAVVTGASSGIGRSIAVELAARGVGRLVVVARRRERLDVLASELERSHGAAVEVIPADLTDGPQRTVVEDRVRSSDDPIDLVVNDAGIGTGGPFHRGDVAAIDGMLELNVVALTRLTRVASGAFVERGRGTIMNISSMATYQPSPGVAAYAATKAYVTHLSEALHEELRPHGIGVTCVLPGFTRTEFADAVGDDEPAVPAFAWMHPDAVARAAVDAAAAGRALCIPGAGYKAAAALVTPLPRSARRWLMGRAAGTFTGRGER